MMLFFPFFDRKALAFGNENAVPAFTQIQKHCSRDDPRHSRDWVSGERNVGKPDTRYEKYCADDIEQMTVGLPRLTRIVSGNHQRDDPSSLFATNRVGAGIGFC